MDEHEQHLLDEVRAAVNDDAVRFVLVDTFTHGTAVQVESHRLGAGPWKKVGPLLFPAEGRPLGDVLTMLADMREYRLKGGDEIPFTLERAPS